MTLTSPANDDVSTGLAHLRTVGRVVVVGPGGIGKSRLVGQLTDALVPDDVIAVDAELVDDVARVESWLLDQAAIPALGGETAAGTLASFAEGRRVAIVIDGADAIVDEVLELVALIPVTAVGPWSIVASRVHPLRPTGPVLRVHPLSLTNASMRSPAERLFRSQFVLAGGSSAMLDAASDVVERVVGETGGIPLAIRVAAARAAATGLTTTDVPGDDIVDGDDPVAQSIGRSVRTLGPDPLRVLDAFSVTAGRVDLGLAEALTDLGTSECRTALGVLARHGLAQAEAHPYTMLPPVLRFTRTHARDRRTDLVARHRDWCLRLVTGVDISDDEARTMLDNEPDIRLAIERALTDGHDEPAAALTIRLVKAYLRTYQQRRSGELLDSVLERLSSSNGALVDERIELLRLSAIVRQESNGVADALPRLDEADQLVDRASSPDRDRARLRALRAGFAHDAGDLTAALDLASEAVQAAIRCGDVFNEMQTGRRASNILMDLGRFDEADAIAADVAERCGAGFAWLAMWAAHDRGLIALERGDRATCEAIARRFLIEAGDDVAARVDADWQLLLADPVKWADRDDTVGLIDPAQPGEWSLHLESQCSAAIRALVAGDGDTALTTASDIVVVAESLPLYWMLLEGLLLTGDAALLLQDRAQAAHTYRRALTGANNRRYMPRVADSLDGLVRAMPDDWTHRAACLAASARIRADLGAVARPRPWLPPIPEAADAVPAGWLDGGRISPAAATAIVKPPEHSDAPGITAPALSRAEMRVALLVAEGCTNREIGQRLHVSRRTVETHVLHAFQKLGVQNRTQLAGQMIRMSSSSGDQLEAPRIGPS